MCREGLFKAIKYYGSQQALADALGVTQPYVNHLLNRDLNIPDIYVITIFILTQGSISLDELSPNPERIRRLLEAGTFYDRFPTTTLPISDIKFENIQCPIHKGTENSLFYIQGEFLSYPILIDTENQLITCPCRIQANILLKNKIICVYQIDLQAVVAGKISINALLEKLPTSERVMVAMAIEAKIGNRSGVRNDLEPVDIYPQVPIGVKTRAVAAKIAGFNSDFLYRQAKFVIEYGSPELIQAMEEQHLPVSKAKYIATLSESQQKQALNLHTTLN